MKKKRRKNASSDGNALPTTLQFWLSLKRSQEQPGRQESRAAQNSSGKQEASGQFHAPAAPGSPAAMPTGSGSGSGSGSGGGGYGLRLVAPDPASQERIRRIMRELCEKDAARKQKK